ncbi:response regulator transcription factor [Bacillus sp. 31A1R]|uniref:Response regulator transcription factor n=1 Tax=Robertmurraya mangrovi TaxID=3098077 RepID=A0ABU5J5N5_9BACI|nr:response regulator transcription factor [Bacillus sp. 31A1R]MDZ5474646.1 response regulator transcription factor [Bacillus sp. 31A1R]
MKNINILVVDDEKEIRQLIAIYLKNEGFNVLEAEDGMTAIALLRINDISLVILDIMMPDKNGIETCVEIRQVSKVPIIFLSAKGEQVDKILGLTAGADDYVTKPFHPLELVARVKSQLRRYLQYETEIEIPNTIKIEELTIKVDSHQVFKGTLEIKLTPREFQILLLLAKQPGKVFSISQIYETIWEEPSIAADNTVMVHIRKLREKIENNSREPKWIKTVWGVGYKIDLKKVYFSC